MVQVALLKFFHMQAADVLKDKPAPQLVKDKKAAVPAAGALPLPPPAAPPPAQALVAVRAGSVSVQASASGSSADVQVHLDGAVHAVATAGKATYLFSCLPLPLSVLLFYIALAVVILAKLLFL